jgi:hypothetical protein
MFCCLLTVPWRLLHMTRWNKQSKLILKYLFWRMVWMSSWQSMLNLGYNIFHVFFHRRLLSICKPRNVNSPWIVPFWPTFKLIHVLVLVANFVRFVLSKFYVNLLEFKPFFQASKDVINGILKVVAIRMINNNTSIISEVWIENWWLEGKSLTYKRKRREPSTEPWGTPCFTTLQFEYVL